ncbi:MAG: histidine kinase [Sutterella wadsworthensis]
MCIIKWLRASIVRQCFVVLAVIGLLAVLAAAPALILTERSTGSGGAINVSGSMRMQSYKLALAVADPFSSFEQRREKTMTALDEFGVKLMSPGLLNGVPHDSGNPAYIQYVALKDRFEKGVRPLAEASIDSLEARRRFTEQIPSSWRTSTGSSRRLRTGSTASCTPAEDPHPHSLRRHGRELQVCFVMQRSIFGRCAIGSAADAVRKGDFSVRAKVPAPDEIGRLATSFNFMVDELGRLYGNLEHEVEKKTEDLNRRNAGLQFLSRVAQSAAWGAVFKRHSLDDLLEESCVQFGARAVRLVVSTDGTAAVLGESDAWPEDEPETGVVRFVLSNANPSMGTLEAVFDAEPEDWQTGFGEALAQTIGRGIERSTRQSDDRRLAVLEERSTIARELHDSIAQSLSYSRIQMHRLKVFIERGEPQEKVMETVNELSEGITTAYRQLREVLTTFRLQISSSGLNGAVEETVEEFRGRTGIATTVSNALLGLELTPNEQIHFVHILREALVNVEKHARASSVRVTLSRGAEHVRAQVGRRRRIPPPPGTT